MGSKVPSKCRKFASSPGSRNSQSHSSFQDVHQGWSVCQLGLLVRIMSVIMCLIYALFTIKRIVALRTFTVTKLIMCIARTDSDLASKNRGAFQASQIPQARKTPQRKTESKQASKQSSQKYLRHLGTSRDTDVPNQMNGGRINNWQDVFGTMYVPIHNVPSSKAGEGTCCCAKFTKYCSDVLTYVFMLRQLLKIR